MTTIVRTDITDKQRIALARAYMNELDIICKDLYGGDYDKMPPSPVGLPIRWNKIIHIAKINTTPAGAAKLVQSTFNNDELVELL